MSWLPFDKYAGFVRAALDEPRDTDNRLILADFLETADDPRGPLLRLAPACAEPADAPPPTCDSVAIDETLIACYPPTPLAYMSPPSKSFPGIDPDVADPVPGGIPLPYCRDRYANVLSTVFVRDALNRFAPAAVIAAAGTSVRRYRARVSPLPMWRRNLVLHELWACGLVDRAYVRTQGVYPLAGIPWWLGDRFLSALWGGGVGRVGGGRPVAVACYLRALARRRDVFEPRWLEPLKAPVDREVCLKAYVVLRQRAQARAFVAALGAVGFDRDAWLREAKGAKLRRSGRTSGGREV